MFIVPAHVWNPDPVQAGIVHKVISGGTSLNDDETLIQTDGGGRWQISYGEIDLDAPYSRRLWDAWVSYLSGGVRRVLVPILSLDTAPWVSAGDRMADPANIWADDDYFPTQVRFAHPYIEAETAGDVALRATTMAINVTRGSRLTPGMKFSVGNRAHIIERITARDGQQATCIVSTPTRAAIPAGTAINFDWPAVQCRAQIGQDLIPNISQGQFGTVSISFVEDFSDVG